MRWLPFRKQTSGGEPEDDSAILLHPRESGGYEQSEIADLASRLSGSRVRPLAEAILKEEPIRSTDLATLAASFYRSIWWTWREPAAAAWALGKLKVEGETRDWVVEQLVAVLDQKTHIRTPKAAWNYACCWFAFSNGIFLGAIPLLLIAENRADRVRAAAARALGEQKSAFALTSLLMAVTDAEQTVRGNSTRGVRQASKEALRQVVEALPVDCYGEIPDEIVNRCLELLPKPDEELAETMLMALEKFAGGRALKAVQLIAKRGRTPRLKAIAEMVLPVLERRSILERAKESLLRAASAPADVSKLLRPVGSSQPVDEDKLLRPATDIQERSERAEAEQDVQRLG